LYIISSCITKNLITKIAYTYLSFSVKNSGNQLYYLLIYYLMIDLKYIKSNLK